MKKLLILSSVLFSGIMLWACEDNRLTDTRDNQVYEIVKIGSQWWMAENLNYETEGSFCYNDDPKNCDTYGRLYEYETALSGACPSGWHLPTDEEWSILIRAIDPDSDPSSEMVESSTAGYEMKSQSGWDGNGNGSNSSGFSAVPSGNRGPDGSYHSRGSSAYIWSATLSYDEENVWRRVIQAFDDGIFRVKHGTLGRSFAVRCVKD